METVKHLTTAELEAGVDDIRQSPKAVGVLEMIVRRPATEQRAALTEGELNHEEGLAGDNWRSRDSSTTPDTQLTLMNTRAIALIAQDKDRWALAGDQLFVDLDLSDDNLPAGSRLALGSAVVEVSPIPHTGCKKFTERFGLDAMKFVNSPVGKALRLRGINAKVVQPGVIRVGDAVTKL